MNITKKSISYFGFLILLFIGAIIWAKSSDPFSRRWFKVQTDGHGKVECVEVLPKPIRPCPVIVWLHGSGDSILTDGRPLRQLAELGMAAVSLEYNQTNYAIFEDQFRVLLEDVQRQPWALSNSVALIGSSLGAQTGLSYLLKHPHTRLRLFVRMSGGLVGDLPRSDANSQLASLPPTLLVHGERDEIFPVGDARALSELLSSNGVAVNLKILPKMGHTFDENRAEVIRVVGEFCRDRLMPDQPVPEFTRPFPVSFLMCAIPAFLWACGWVYQGRKKAPLADTLAKDVRAPHTFSFRRLPEIGVRVATLILAALAIGQIALHLVPPRMKVNEFSLRIAREHLIAPNWGNDFDALAIRPLWNGQRLSTLLTHVELAHYTVYELVNWKLEESIYRDYVLSPAIAPDSDAELNWRRPLWEFFYPRIRKENTTTSAAEIIARTLRERVTIWPAQSNPTTSASQWPREIQAIWGRKITDEMGFERIYVATLRSVGVPARLDAFGKAEYWDTGQWRAAPHPLLSTWRDLVHPIPNHSGDSIESNGLGRNKPQQ